MLKRLLSAPGGAANMPTTEPTVEPRPGDAAAQGQDALTPPPTRSPSPNTTSLGSGASVGNVQPLWAGALANAMDLAPAGHEFSPTPVGAHLVGEGVDTRGSLAAARLFAAQRELPRLTTGRWVSDVGTVIDGLAKFLGSSTNPRVTPMAIVNVGYGYALQEWVSKIVKPRDSPLEKLTPAEVVSVAERVIGLPNRSGVLQGGGAVAVLARLLSEQPKLDDWVWAIDGGGYRTDDPGRAKEYFFFPRSLPAPAVVTAGPAAGWDVNAPLPRYKLSHQPTFGGRNLEYGDHSVPKHLDHMVYDAGGRGAVRTLAEQVTSLLEWRNQASGWMGEAAAEVDSSAAGADVGAAQRKWARFSADVDEMADRLDAWDVWGPELKQRWTTLQNRYHELALLVDRLPFFWAEVVGRSPAVEALPVGLGASGLLLRRRFATAVLVLAGESWEQAQGLAALWNGWVSGLAGADVDVRKVNREAKAWVARAGELLVTLGVEVPYRAPDTTASARNVKPLWAGALGKAMSLAPAGHEFSPIPAGAHLSVEGVDTRASRGVARLFTAQRELPRLTTDGAVASVDAVVAGLAKLLGSSTNPRVTPMAIVNVGAGPDLPEWVSKIWKPRGSPLQVLTPGKAASLAERVIGLPNRSGVLQGGGAVAVLARLLSEQPKLSDWVWAIDRGGYRTDDPGKAWEYFFFPRSLPAPAVVTAGPAAGWDVNAPARLWPRTPAPHPDDSERGAPYKRSRYLAVPEPMGADGAMGWRMPEYLGEWVSAAGGSGAVRTLAEQVTSLWVWKNLASGWLGAAVAEVDMSAVEGELDAAQRTWGRFSAEVDEMADRLDAWDVSEDELSLRLSVLEREYSELALLVEQLPSSWAEVVGRSPTVEPLPAGLGWSGRGVRMRFATAVRALAGVSWEQAMGLATLWNGWVSSLAADADLTEVLREANARVVRASDLLVKLGVKVPIEVNRKVTLRAGSAGKVDGLLLETSGTDPVLVLGQRHRWARLRDAAEKGGVRAAAQPNRIKVVVQLWANPDGVVVASGEGAATDPVLFGAGVAAALRDWAPGDLRKRGVELFTAADERVAPQDRQRITDQFMAQLRRELPGVDVKQFSLSSLSKVPAPGAASAAAELSAAATGVPPADTNVPVFLAHLPNVEAPGPVAGAAAESSAAAGSMVTESDILAAAVETPLAPVTFGVVPGREAAGASAMAGSMVTASDTLAHGVDPGRGGGGAGGVGAVEAVASRRRGDPA